MKTKEGGFTIVELVVTLVVTTLIVIAVLSLFITINQTQRSTIRTESATRAGEQQIESLRNNHYGSLEPDTSINFTENLPSNLPEPRSAIANITEPAAGLRRVDITITYQDGSKQKEVKLSSLIGQLGIGQ